MKISLYVPNVEDLWFRKECMEDPKTMSYNAGYDVSYSGYHYDSGCIDFPKDKWQNWYNEKINNNNLFYAYILDEEKNNYVGYLNFNLNTQNGRSSMGIVIKDNFRGKGYMKPAMLLLIEEARRRNIKYLINTVPENREVALKSFYSLGFKKVDEYVSNKFGKPEIVAKIEKRLLILK